MWRLRAAGNPARSRNPTRGVRSHSLRSSFQLCSASVLGWMHFLRPAYSCCIGNFIASPIMIMGAANKESKMPLQSGITFHTANLYLVLQVGVRPTPEGRGTGAHLSPAQTLCKADSSQPHRSDFGEGQPSLGGGSAATPPHLLQAGDCSKQ